MSNGQWQTISFHLLRALSAMMEVQSALGSVDAGEVNVGSDMTVRECLRVMDRSTCVEKRSGETSEEPHKGTAMDQSINEKRSVVTQKGKCALVQLNSATSSTNRVKGNQRRGKRVQRCSPNHIGKTLLRLSKRG